MTLESILCEWQSMEELLDGGDFTDWVAAPAPEVKDAWWTPAWVPCNGSRVLKVISVVLGKSVMLCVTLHGSL